MWLDALERYLASPHCKQCSCSYRALLLVLSVFPLAASIKRHGTAEGTAATKEGVPWLPHSGWRGKGWQGLGWQDLRFD